MRREDNKESEEQQKWIWEGFYRNRSDNNDHSKRSCFLQSSSINEVPKGSQHEEEGENTEDNHNLEKELLQVGGLIGLSKHRSGLSEKGVFSSQNHGGGGLTTGHCTTHLRHLTLVEGDWEGLTSHRTLVHFYGSVVEHTICGDGGSGGDLDQVTRHQETSVEGVDPLAVPHTDSSGLKGRLQGGDGISGFGGFVVAQARIEQVDRDEDSRVDVVLDDDFDDGGDPDHNWHGLPHEAEEDEPLWRNFLWQLVSPVFLQELLGLSRGETLRNGEVLQDIVGIPLPMGMIVRVRHGFLRGLRNGRWLAPRRWWLRFCLGKRLINLKIVINYGYYDCGVMFV